MLRSRQVMLHQYLYDWLGKSMTRVGLIQDRDLALNLVQEMGCIVNWEKSELVPTQHFEFVGVVYDLVKGLVMPALEKRDRLKEFVQPFLESDMVTARHFQQINGFLNNMQPLVPWGRIHTRILQMNLNSHWSPQKLPQNHKLPVWEESLEEVLWWLEETNFFRGAPLHPPESQITMFTDASKGGWGAHVDNKKMCGSWSVSETLLHINILEMRAVILALKELNPPRNTNILVKTDNSTLVAFINNQGGTRSNQLLLETLDLYQILQDKNWVLRAVYLPGVKNVLADSLSRKFQAIPSEWSLHPQVVQDIFAEMGRPMIDLFATAQNAKLPVYVLSRPDPLAYAEDALAIDWNGIWAYAYPPTAILSKVIEKVMVSSGKLILIAPCWPAQSWYQDLVRFSIRPPIQLPLKPTLLKQTGKDIFHSNPERLNLHAWLLQNSI